MLGRDREWGEIFSVLRRAIDRQGGVTGNGGDTQRSAPRHRQTGRCGPGYLALRDAAVSVNHPLGGCGPIGAAVRLSYEHGGRCGLW